MSQCASFELILVPASNRLTLATFALLWASKWVRLFFAPLLSDQIAENPGLSEFVRRVFNPEESHLIAREYGWTFLTDILPTFQKVLDEQVYARMLLRLGIGGALGIIREQLYDR